jgi:hypothetical protein
MNITHPLIGRTCEAPALVEVHPLHAVGEHELADVTWEEGKKESEK